MRRVLLCALAAVAALTLISCAQPKPKIEIQKPKPLPAWYLTPPAHDAQWLYGVSLGGSMEEATREALDNLLAQLSVSVESSLEINTQARQGDVSDYTQETRRTIRSEVAKIRIGNYQVAEAEQIKYNQFAVMVRSDRNGFAQSLIDELDVRFAQIADRMKTLASGHIAERYAFLKQASAQAEGSLPTVAIVKGIKPGFDDKGYLEKTRQIGEAFASVRQNLRFRLNAQDGPSAKMGQPLQAALAKEGFALGGGAGALEISVRTESKRFEASGLEIADFLVLIEVREPSGLAVGGNRHTFKTAASRGMETALESAASQLDRKIQSEGIAAVLGLTL
ncbi:MAG: LPP20 family lipoprotein [Campylobacterales bacterium]